MERGDRNRPPVTKRSYSRETEERSRERDRRGSADPVRRVSSMTDDRGSRERDRARSKETGERFGWVVGVGCQMEIGNGIQTGLGDRRMATVFHSS